MSKKNICYSYDIKIRAVMMKLQGQQYCKIQNRFHIKNHRQIYNWVKWYQTGQIHRFQTPIGHQYRNSPNYLLTQHDAQISLIKKTIQTQLAKNQKNHRALYLKIINQYKTQISLNRLLKWLNFNKSSYYRALKNMIHPRPLTMIEKTIYQICHQNPIHPLLKNQLILGHRKVHYLLKQQGIQLNRKTVLKKMQQFNLLCQTKKNTLKVKKTQKFYHQIHIKNRPNLLNLNFYASQPYQKLVTDITYLPHNLYLSAIMDLYNREIVAFQITHQPNLNLVINTVNQLPPLKTPCILHADQGVQYTNIKVVKFLKERNFQPSFSPKASPLHNSPLESFWGNLKSETLKMINKNYHLTNNEIITIITNFIQYYNQSRPHQYLNYYPPQIFKLQNGLQN